jgi:protein-S-isoprenylcysteine O-methyltransferase Ste14
VHISALPQEPDMPEIFAAVTLMLLIAMVITRALLLKRQGIQAMNFGKTDKTDFLIPPFAFLFFYMVFANAFGWRMVSTQRFFDSAMLAWTGVLFCFTGLLLFLWSLVSFGRSFRVGIDAWQPGKLVTTGAFAATRNPIYVAFALILLGQFLVFPNWIILLYLIAGFWLFHRQVLREEEFLEKHYGEDFLEYARRVKRYL